MLIVIIQTDQGIQVDLTPPPPPAQDPSERQASEQDSETIPMQILNDSLNSWKQRLEKIRKNSNTNTPPLGRSSDSSSIFPNRHKSSEKIGYNLPAESIHFKLKKRIDSASVHESE